MICKNSMKPAVGGDEVSPRPKIAWEKIIRSFSISTSSSRGISWSWRLEGWWGLVFLAHPWYVKICSTLPKTTSTIANQSQPHQLIILEVPTMLPQRLLRTTTLFSSLWFHQIGLWISLSLHRHLDIVAHFHVFFCPRLAPKLKGPYPCSEFPLSLPSEKFAQSLFLGVGDLAILILFVGSLYVMLGSFSPRVIEGEALAKHLLDLVQGQSLYIVLSFIPLWIIRWSNLLGILCRFSVKRIKNLTKNP